MAYVKTIWKDSPDETTPLNSANLNKIENGIATLDAEKADKAQEAWITPTLTNGWVSEPTDPVGYLKDQFGWVRFKGKIKDGTLGTVALTMPVGYRKSSAVLLPFYSGNGSNTTIGGLSTGTWLYILNKNATINMADLSSISYKADA